MKTLLSLAIIMLMCNCGEAPIAPPSAPKTPPHRTGIECTTDQAAFLTWDVCSALLDLTELPSLSDFTATRANDRFNVAGVVPMASGNVAVSMDWDCSSGEWRYGTLLVAGDTFNMGGKEHLLKN